ncbi:efflux RND transporter periplasmic adaptor subunit [Gemmatimonadota bacterium]
MKKLVIGLLIVVVAGGGIYLYAKKRNDKEEAYKKVAVEQGTIVEKALAIGKIDPDYEIVVKSQVSGIVDILYKEVGEEVSKGDPLMVVKPEPTPLELASVRRELEMAELNLDKARRDLDRARELKTRDMMTEENFEDKEKTFFETELREKQARERLELTEKGKSKIGGKQVETLIRSPIDGMILERLVNRGDPVVPLTSYQPGTELMKLADMANLIFIGTVDEIDVGKLKEGMTASIHIGALPSDTLSGELYFISPKSKTKDNAIVFDIKIRITDISGINLRAGYSANADIVIRSKEDVPSLPERLVTFRNDSSFVKIPNEADSLVDHPIEVGLSDGLTLEVVDGLAVGDSVAEEPPKEIE